MIHPEITIVPDTKPEEFINCLEKLVDSSQRFLVERSYQDSFSYGITVSVTENSQDNQLILTLITYFDENHVEVTIANRKTKNPSDSLSIADFKRIKKKIINSLVELYNKAYKANCKLRLRFVLSYSLPPQAKKKFERFTKLANKRAIHPLDWQRFYEFVRFCNAHSVKLSPSRLYELLKEENFSQKQSEHLANLYRHGRGILGNKWFCL